MRGITRIKQSNDILHFSDCMGDNAEAICNPKIKIGSGNLPTTNPRRVTCPDCLEKMKKLGTIYKCPKCDLVDITEINRKGTTEVCSICNSIVTEYQ